MKSLTIRGLDEETIAALGEIAAALKQSREQYLRDLLTAAAMQGLPPAIGGGLHAIGDDEAIAIIKNYGLQVLISASNLTEDQMKAVTRARLKALPQNGGKWLEARRVLSDAGFKVFDF